MFILKQVLSDTFRCLLYTQGFFLFNGIKCFLLKKSTKVFSQWGIMRVINGMPVMVSLKIKSGYATKRTHNLNYHSDQAMIFSL